MSDETHVMSTTDRLVYMAHQIARNLASLGDTKAAEALADHLQSFWDPRMKEQLIAIARDEPQRLSPIVAEAVMRMVRGADTAHSGATEFNAVDEVGHCDAG